MAQDGTQSDWTQLSGDTVQHLIDRTKSNLMIALNCLSLNCKFHLLAELLAKALQ